MTNPRFVSLLSHVHHSYTDWWIRFLKRAWLDGIYDTSDSLQILHVKFCFSPLMQKDLDDVKDYQNNHLICQSMESDSE